MSETTDAPFVVTLKGGDGFKAPWIVVRGDTADEVASNLEALAETGLYGLVSEAASLFGAANNVANPSGRAPAPAAAGSDEPAQGAESTTPARQRGAAAAPSSSGYARKKAQAGTGGRGGRKPKLTYEEASADCKHGERRRFTKPGATWVGYGCPQPKDAEDNCGAQFIDAEDDLEG